MKEGPWTKLGVLVAIVGVVISYFAFLKPDNSVPPNQNNERTIYPYRIIDSDESGGDDFKSKNSTKKITIPIEQEQNYLAKLSGTIDIGGASWIFSEYDFYFNMPLVPIGKQPYKINGFLTVPDYTGFNEQYFQISGSGYVTIREGKSYKVSYYSNSNGNYVINLK